MVRREEMHLRRRHTVRMNIKFYAFWPQTAGCTGWDRASRGLALTELSGSQRSDAARAGEKAAVEAGLPQERAAGKARCGRPAPLCALWRITQDSSLL